MDFDFTTKSLLHYLGLLHHQSFQRLQNVGYFTLIFLANIFELKVL